MKVYFVLILSMLVSMAVTSSLRKKFNLADTDSEHIREQQAELEKKMANSDDTKVLQRKISN